MVRRVFNVVLCTAIGREENDGSLAFLYARADSAWARSACGRSGQCRRGDGVPAEMADGAARTGLSMRPELLFRRHGRQYVGRGSEKGLYRLRPHHPSARRRHGHARSAARRWTTFTPYVGRRRISPELAGVRALAARTVAPCLSVGFLSSHHEARPFEGAQDDGLTEGSVCSAAACRSEVVTSQPVSSQPFVLILQACSPHLHALGAATGNSLAQAAGAAWSMGCSSMLSDRSDGDASLPAVSRRTNVAIRKACTTTRA